MRPSGVQPRPLPKPPHNTPVLPPIQSSLLQQPSSPHTLTRTATGFNIDWKGGNVMQIKIKEKKLKRQRSPAGRVYPLTQHMPLKFSVSQPVYTLFALCSRESGQTSQSRQVKASFVHSTPSPSRRAYHQHHSARTLNGHQENHLNHGALSSQRR